MRSTRNLSAAAKFRALRQSGCFALLPRLSPWARGEDKGEGFGHENALKLNPHPPPLPYKERGVPARAVRLDLLKSRSTQSRIKLPT